MSTEALTTGCFLQRRGDRLDQKRHRRELDAAGGVVVLALLAHVFELGDVGVVEVRELRDRRVREDHVAGDGLPHPRHLLDADHAVIVGVGLAGRRDAARRAGGHLFVRLADERLHIVGRDAAAVARWAARRRSTPNCRASRRTAGPAADAAWPSPGSSSSGSATFTSRCGRGLLRSAPCGAGAGSSASSSSTSGSGSGSFFFAGFGVAAGASFFGSAFFAAGLRLRLSRCAAPASISMSAAPTFTVSPSADENLGDLPGRRAGHRHRRLVGLDFEQVLILLDGVAFAHQDREHVAGFDILAQIGQLDLIGHVRHSDE